MASNVRADEIVETATRHIGAFLAETSAEKHFERYGELLKLSLMPHAGYNLTREPDRSPTFLSGEEWLRTVPSHADIVRQLEKEADYHRASTFVVRSFLYLAYADVYDVLFTPDSVRAKPLETIIDREWDLRGQLLSKFKEFTASSLTCDPNVMQEKLTPLAAIVFARAYPDKNNIPAKMAELRSELADLRGRLRASENIALWERRSLEMEERRRWENAFRELEATFWRGEALVSIKGALNFGKDVAELAGKTASGKPPTFGDVAKAMLGLPLSVTTRLLQRRPAVEFYRLGERELLASGLPDVVKTLFGTIKRN